MEAQDLSTLHYAPWLEKALQELVNFPVKGICMHAITDNGDVYSNYYQIPMKDKLTIAGTIQQDAMYDSLAANGVIQYDDEDEEN